MGSTFKLMATIALRLALRTKIGTRLCLEGRLSLGALHSGGAFGRKPMQRPHSHYPFLGLKPPFSLLASISLTPPSCPHPNSMLRYPDPINGSASAQHKLGYGTGRLESLDEARDLALIGEALIDPRGLENVRERSPWCVLHSK